MFRKNYKGDIVGGIISALVSLPLALACGLLLFKGFGDLQQFGINAAFYTAIIGSVISIFIGNHSLQIGGPLVVTALILSDFLINISTKIEYTSADINTVLFTLMFSCVILTGLIQLLFAYLRFGNLIKFLPSSVTKGISTTIGIIIIVKQLPIVFNSNNSNTSETFLLVFITSFMLILLLLKNFVPNKEKLKEKIRFDLFIILPVLVPILAGVIFFSFNTNPNLLLGNVKVELPNLIYNYNSFILSISTIKSFLPQIFLTSFAIALMSSLSSLLSVNLLENKFKSNTNSQNTSLELNGQGIGNILSGLFGGMPSSGTEARSLVNYDAGGRTRFSVIVNVVTIFLVIFIFNDYLAFIPEIILSAMLIYTGVIMSMPTLNMIKKLYYNCSKKTKKQNCIKDVLYSFSIIITMLITAFVSDITIAIVFGFAVASLYFIYEMMKNSNFTVLNRSIIRSKKERPTNVNEFLHQNGKDISIVELDGSIFFGTADALRNTISSIKSKWIILDFRKVVEVDITGAEIIKQAIDENSKKNEDKVNFILSHIRLGDDTYEALCSVDVIGTNKLKWYEYTDKALEYAENQLLVSHNIINQEDNKILDLNEMNIARNLDNKERKILLEYLDIQAFLQNEYLFKENEESDSIYFLRNGSVTVWDEHEKDFYKDSSVSKTRRVTFSAGVVVGQMAFFENTKHSVEAQADENILTYVLTKSNFNKLLEEHPFVAQDLLLEFCKHLSKRLREVTYEVQILERWH